MINWIKCVTSMDTEGTITHFTTKKKMINKGMSTKLDREIEQDFPNKNFQTNCKMGKYHIKYKNNLKVKLDVLGAEHQIKIFLPKSSTNHTACLVRWKGKTTCN